MRHTECLGRSGGKFSPVCTAALVVVALGLGSAHSQGVQPSTPAPSAPASTAPVQDRTGEFADLSTLREIATGFRFTEGPLWLSDGRLIFSDIPANTIYSIKPSADAAGPVMPEEAEVFRTPSGNANGNTLDLEGRLISAQHNGQVTRRAADGTITVIASTHEGKQLNSPNDVVMKRDGSIYFTDPPFGRRPEKRELDFSGVFRLSADGSTTMLARDFDRPNGLAFSPDEGTLYVSDTRTNTINAYDLKPDGTLGSPRAFAKMSGPGQGSGDGVKVDQAGRVFATGPGGVWIFSPEGVKLGLIPVPRSTNLCFGGPDARTLFITAGPSVHAVRLTHAGPLPGTKPAPAVSSQPK